jgi:hypothetical protein
VAPSQGRTNSPPTRRAGWLLLPGASSSTPTALRPHVVTGSSGSRPSRRPDRRRPQTARCSSSSCAPIGRCPRPAVALTRQSRAHQCQSPSRRDGGASVHHCAVMLQSGVRTTIDLPDDLHKQASAIARDTRRTLSETVADLMRRGLAVGRSRALSTDPRTGLPLLSVGAVVTSEDVRSLEDEE